ncbi:hypothetical protein RFY44_19935 [Acinetobacter bereziniae]|uniref:ABC-three component system protein n=1 Tax=Acinetobacter bereziniae TaxID=106648 RepID=UPI0028129047|nr:ABC-three component system protein [Acinetobacter bereziniae]MDQ9821120.1 hypothetical protein [Acinetobacter bereziniae]
MNEKIKSSLHDAVPSWNGYNFQGKVGLYVCLKNILDKLNDCDLKSWELTEFLKTHLIEYEWIEDFSIKYQETYISLHQVKHKEGTGFNNYIDAIVTILNRKLCRLSEADFIKYVTLNYDYSCCNDDESKKLKKTETIQNKMDEMRSVGYLDINYKLKGDWRDIDQEVSEVNNSELKKLLSDFEIFTENTFKNSKVYFHTSEKVSKPKKELHEYAEIPSYHHSTVNGLKTLEALNIFMGFDSQKDYLLDLDDESLLLNIQDVIGAILNKLHPDEIFFDEQISIYVAMLLKIIDSHLIERHKAIRNKVDQGVGFNEKRKGIIFKELLEPLREIVRKEDIKYWEGFCMNTFESLCIEEIEKLDYLIKDDVNIIENKRKKDKIERYRLQVMESEVESYIDLFIRLSPHVNNNASNVSFYNEISNKHLIKNVFLNFIQKVKSYNHGFIVSPNKDFKIHPTIISFSLIDDDELEYEIGVYRHNISNNSLIFLNGITHLTAKTNCNQSISGVSVGLDSFVESIKKDMDTKSRHNITEINDPKFISVDDALKVINND